jgi:TonB family protein
VKTADIEKDLYSIHILSNKSTKKIRPIIYLSVAASVLILIASIFILKDSDSTQIKQTADLFVTEQIADTTFLDNSIPLDSIGTMNRDSSKTLLADAAIPESKSIKSNVKEPPTNTLAFAAKSSEESKKSNRIEKEGKKIPTRALVAVNAPKEIQMEPIANNSISDDEATATASTTIAAKLELEFDTIEIEEEVLEKLKDITPDEGKSIRKGDNAKSIPFGGFSLFKAYLVENLNYPTSIENAKREVVRIQFTVLLSGELTNFVVLRSPENNDFSKEAIRVLKNGPKWSPAVKDGIAVQDNVSLRVVFKP